MVARLATHRSMAADRWGLAPRSLPNSVLSAAFMMNVGSTVLNPARAVMPRG